jgi:hypothetical protein
MRVNQVFISRKGVGMVDLKKQLLDLAETIRYWDQYDLTIVPNILKEASERIGNLELSLIELEEKIKKLEETSNTKEISESQDEFELQPIEDRAELKRRLDELGIPYQVRDNTHRLRRKLQKALRGSEDV